MDPLTPEQRSAVMSRVRCKDTRPEMIVRRLVHGLGYRYRLHPSDLPGKPDLVFRRSRKVLFIHGCFWHLHENCPLCRPPKSRLEFWRPKLETNKERDRVVAARLHELGWSVMTIWECEL